jgi:hypothetical protein
MNLMKSTLCLLFASTVFARQSARPSFEVASIQPSAAVPPERSIGGVRITGFAL